MANRASRIVLLVATAFITPPAIANAEGMIAHAQIDMRANIMPALHAEPEAAQGNVAFMVAKTSLFDDEGRAAAVEYTFLPAGV